MSSTMTTRISSSSSSSGGGGGGGNINMEKRSSVAREMLVATMPGAKVSKLRHLFEAPTQEVKPTYRARGSTANGVTHRHEPPAATTTSTTATQHSSRQRPTSQELNVNILGQQQSDEEEMVAPSSDKKIDPRLRFKNARLLFESHQATSPPTTRKNTAKQPLSPPTSPQVNKKRYSRNTSTDSTCSSVENESPKRILAVRPSPVDVPEKLSRRVDAKVSDSTSMRSTGSISKVSQETSNQQTSQERTKPSPPTSPRMKAHATHTEPLVSVENGGTEKHFEDLREQAAVRRAHMHSRSPEQDIRRRSLDDPMPYVSRELSPTDIHHVQAPKTKAAVPASAIIALNEPEINLHEKLGLDLEGGTYLVDRKSPVSPTSPTAKKPLVFRSVGSPRKLRSGIRRYSREYEDEESEEMSSEYSTQASASDTTVEEREITVSAAKVEETKASPSWDSSIVSTRTGSPGRGPLVGESQVQISHRTDTDANSDASSTFHSPTSCVDEANQEPRLITSKHGTTAISGSNLDKMEMAMRTKETAITNEEDEEEEEEEEDDDEDDQELRDEEMNTEALELQLSLEAQEILNRRAKPAFIEILDSSLDDDLDDHKDTQEDVNEHATQVRNSIISKLVHLTFSV